VRGHQNSCFTENDVMSGAVRKKEETQISNTLRKDEEQGSVKRQERANEERRAAVPREVRMYSFR
jgi:hypothetical protein